MMSSVSYDERLALVDAAAPIDPHDHQRATWDRLDSAFLDHKRTAGMVVLPTGAGKTIMAAHWLLRHEVAKGGRVLWLAHRQSLLSQAYRSFKRLANLAYPGKKSLDLIAVSSEFRRWSSVSREHDVVFASIQSSVMEQNRGFVKELLADAGAGATVVVDEAHHAVAPKTYGLLSEIKKAGVRLLGLTATPIRMDPDEDRRLGMLFEDIVHQVSRRSLVDAGILAAPVTETVKTEVSVEREMSAEDLAYLDRYGELAPSVLARLGKNAHRNALIVEHYLKNKERYGPTIMFAADTLHAQTLAHELSKHSGIRADYVDYSRRDAATVTERYARGELDVIVNVQMLTEGFDAPHTRTVFICRPTRSESLVVQMVGRALRGPRAGGNAKANLVTFLDTWQQYDVLGPEYALERMDVPPPEAVSRVNAPMVLIPPELVRDAYRLLQSNLKGQLVGVHACVPHGWYRWEEVFEDDVQSRTVMVFDSQREALEALLAEHASPSSIPEHVTEDLACSLIRRHFSDIPDPLPRWADVKALLDARRKGCDVSYVTFEEKLAFDPTALAQQLLERNLNPRDEADFLAEVWATQPACPVVYRHDEAAFREEVGRERTKLLNASIERPPTAPEVTSIVPSGPPRAYEPGHGRDLGELLAAVLEQKRHFPGGAPMLGSLRWMKRANQRLWGFFRYEDKCLALNPILNSPDVPRFVVELVMFHELLHADMPSAGHNAAFRARERGFVPSATAIDEARPLGLVPTSASAVDYWRVRAEMFLDTFERYFEWKRPTPTY